MRLRNQVAIITGATSGLGAAMAKRFAAEGARVAVVGRNRERAEEVIASIGEKGGESFFIQADVTEEADAQGVIDQTLARFGTIDIVANNAGRNRGSGRLFLLTGEQVCNGCYPVHRWRSCREIRRGASEPAELQNSDMIVKD